MGIIWTCPVCKRFVGLKVNGIWSEKLYTKTIDRWCEEQHSKETDTWGND